MIFQVTIVPGMGGRTCFTKKLRTGYDSEPVFIDEVFLDYSVSTYHPKNYCNNSDDQKYVNDVAHSEAGKAKITDQP